MTDSMSRNPEAQAAAVRELESFRRANEQSIALNASRAVDETRRAREALDREKADAVRKAWELGQEDEKLRNERERRKKEANSALLGESSANVPAAPPPAPGPATSSTSEEVSNAASTVEEASYMGFGTLQDYAAAADHMVKASASAGKDGVDGKRADREARAARAVDGALASVKGEGFEAVVSARRRRRQRAGGYTPALSLRRCVAELRASLFGI